VINTARDITLARAAYERFGFLQLADVLHPLCADIILAKLQHEQTRWYANYTNSNGNPQRRRYQASEGSSRKKMTPFHPKLQEVAKNGYAFFYDNIVCDQMSGYGPEEGEVLDEFTRVINGPESHNFFENLLTLKTGKITHISVQYTRFFAGHFIKSHTDQARDRQRFAAYTISLTKNWAPDSGGILHFVGDAGDIERSVIPTFNTLTLFSVPREHFVSPVAHYVDTPRYSITGWVYI